MQQTVQFDSKQFAAELRQICSDPIPSFYRAREAGQTARKWCVRYPCLAETAEAFVRIAELGRYLDDKEERALLRQSAERLAKAYEERAVPSPLCQHPTIDGNICGAAISTMLCPDRTKHSWR